MARASPHLRALVPEGVRCAADVGVLGRTHAEVPGLGDELLLVLDVFLGGRRSLVQRVEDGPELRVAHHLLLDGLARRVVLGLLELDAVDDLHTVAQ